MNDFQTYIFKSRYARWRDDLGRRETWEEVVTRYCDFWKGRYGDVFPYERIYNAIYNLEVVPSMRALMTAGPALERDNIAGYNCSYIPIIDQRCFSEVMFILMNGTGVGFSVERQYVQNLPEVPEITQSPDEYIVVEDSKEGWARALEGLIMGLYNGTAYNWSLHQLRPAGAKLHTFGGRSSGPKPLDELFKFTVALFKKAAGRKLSSLECHDLVCKIAQVVVVGGVRRSALISLSNLTDARLRDAKTGVWWEDEAQRALANNSVAYTEKPDIGIFMKEWQSLYESKSGERGIFNRVAAKLQAKATGRRDFERDFGTNPCGEIILRPFGFCNLSEVIVRSGDTPETLRNKVELATIIGTFQSTLTDFKYIRKEWITNAEEERLLGVSMTGIMDSKLTSGGAYGFNEMLENLKQHAVNVNEVWAGTLNIPQSTAITTVKPSGTVSQLVDSASGIHPRYSPYYIRTVRADVKDPLAQFLKDVGVPYEEDVTNSSNLVFSFPIKSPDTSVMRSDMGAVQQLEHYLSFKKYWCEHNPSITVYVKEHEWLDVGAWVYKNFDDLGGVSFLPYSDHVYRQAPYQEINEVEYTKLVSEMPAIDWSKFDAYETEDTTKGMQELACTNGSCEII